MEVPSFMYEKAVESLRGLVKAVNRFKLKEIWKEYDNAVIVLKDIEFWKEEG